MRLLLTIFSIALFTVTLIGQSNEKHLVYFEEGQASISLEQLDKIKALAKKSMKAANGRIVVHTYANDALEGDANDRLSGRRAYLVQQCLERAGVPLGYMQIENKIWQNSEKEGCEACAEILVTTDSNFFSQNIYQDHVADFLIEESGVEAQTFWVQPFENVSVTTKDGVLIQIPSGALMTKDSGLVKLEVRFLQTRWEMLLHSLTTRSAEQAFLDLNRAVHLEIAQYGEPLRLRKDQQITVIVPSDVYHKNAELYEQQKTDWSQSAASNHLKAGSFYIGDDYWCKNLSNTTGMTPNYSTPPAKPIHIPYDSMTIEQDKKLESIQLRLDYFEEQKVDKKGKPKKLTKEQKQSAYLLKNQKDRLLIQKEKIKIRTREQNEAREETYYRTLAIYNQERHRLQRLYINGLDSLGSIQKANINRCAALKENVNTLKENYGQAAYEKIAASLRNQQVKDKLGYWMQVSELGWLGIGEKALSKNLDAVPYRVTTPISAYKITAFLIFDKSQHIVLGETLDATDIVFWEVPDGQSAKLLAVTQEGDNFLVAFHDLTTNGNPIELNFKRTKLSDLLDLIK